jgi:RNA ligase
MARIVEVAGEKIQTMSHNQVIERDQLVDRGLLRSDDLGNLRVYTYTDACTFSGQWNEITRHSRGHIFDITTGECIACTFPKFFNLNEKPETQENILPWLSGYTVFEKLDGWLGNLYRFNGEFRIATRGSFNSPGADWANRFLKQNFNLSDLPDELTLVFELICPVTKIIVDYGSEEKLVLLTIFNRHTGEECPWNFVIEVAQRYGFEVPKIYGSDIEECKRFLASANGRNLEGFVIRFANGQRIKIKAEDYVRRAKIKSRLTPLGIWEIMVNGRVPESCYKLIDIEYHEYLDSLRNILEQRFVDVNTEIYDEFSSIDSNLSRKDFAQAIKSKIHKPIMFACLDGRSVLIDKYVMEKIRPHNNRM